MDRPCIETLPHDTATFFEAAENCAARGARLCRYAEWIAACRGKVDFMNTVPNMEWVDSAANNNGDAKTVGIGFDGQTLITGSGCGYGSTIPDRLCGLPMLFEQVMKWLLNIALLAVTPCMAQVGIDAPIQFTGPAGQRGIDGITSPTSADQLVTVGHAVSGMAHWCAAVLNVDTFQLAMEPVSAHWPMHHAPFILTEIPTFLVRS